MATASPPKTSAPPSAAQNGAASISLPKGGGAIRGVGEKFAASPVTGTGSMTVPLSLSPGRSGFGPQLSLSYDSGSGNGPFGFGWSLSPPSITRKTDKGLPQYRDAEESDVYILSGVEDLVPVLKQQGNEWLPEDVPDQTVAGQTYRIQRYRPRIEGLFARIERWTNRSIPDDTFWRSISKDNITTWYGKTEESRIADAHDASRIFSWRICESYDDKGNVIVYGYKQEDASGIDLTQACELNRSDNIRKTNRYLKRIRYGNHSPYFPEFSEGDPWPTPPGATATDASNDWFFEVVFDYGDHDTDVPLPDEPQKQWLRRNDPFSSYRSGFEVRTYRICQRVLMFHHFVDEAGVGANCLVRSTDFNYSFEADPTSAQNPIFSYLLSATQSGYRRQQGGYIKKSLPPLELSYSQVPTPEELAQQPIEDVVAENLPAGLDGRIYQWLDLNGTGTSGVLTEQADGWYYKENLSANNQVSDDDQKRTVARFGPIELVAKKPAAGITAGTQFLDLAGDGQIDLVQLEGALRGFYERTDDLNWKPFQPFVSWPDVNTRDPNLKFVDLTGDGHADILITRGDTLSWCPSLGEQGFGPETRLSLPLDEEHGPRLLFGDGSESIYLADLSGDGLTDIVRISNGEVCYWPNLGYGRFGAKVTMDNAPWFDSPDQFDQARIRLADTDGSGTTDILYLRRDGVQIYFNQSGNSWSNAVALPQFLPSDNVSSVQAIDLLGNGTACLVWSSPLPSAVRAMRYVELMKEKPHLLVAAKNNLGAETKVHYTSSTKFFLDDKQDGQPWTTRLPFPVHVVERVETFDYVSRSYFVTRYAYHHGHFDGDEREFRGFGLVEQWDTEKFAALDTSGGFPTAGNIDDTFHVPPVLTKTWFHTGAYIEGQKISQQFAHEYYGAPNKNDPDFAQKWKEFESSLLPDTVFVAGLTVEQEREACRALKGSMLHQEIYARDATDKEKQPYIVSEQNSEVQLLQPRGENRHGVFFNHVRESITYHYERNPQDPRIQHALTLQVDEFGNILKEATIAYGRRETITVVDDQGSTTEVPNPDLMVLDPPDREKQTQTLITYTENRVAIDVVDSFTDYRAPLACETRTWELTGFTPENNAATFSFNEWTKNGFALVASATEIPYEQVADNVAKQKRLIEHVRTLYRKNDLSALLQLGDLESHAVAGETYKLSLTPGLRDNVFGTKVTEAMLADEGGYVHSEGDDLWWIPSGRVFFTVDADVDNPAVTAATELAQARAHFFLPRKFANPFKHSATIDYDEYDLLTVKTKDALDNEVTAQNDYRVLQHTIVADANGNRSQVAFDALGMVTGTAVMGKATETFGDLLDDSFAPDLTQAQLDAFMAAPREPSPNSGESVATQIVHELLGSVTTRVIYDLDRFQRLGEPPFTATVARETHLGSPGGPETNVQISFTYSDGLGREIQKKTQAESGPVVDAGPVVNPRWVGSGWIILNNKGKLVRQYEPFFSATHSFEFDVQAGVSPVLFYDPVGRVIATVHPNHSYEKAVFDAWHQSTYDENDTVTLSPQTDPDIASYVHQYFQNVAPNPGDWLTWLQQRIDPGNPPADTPQLAPEQKAAVRTLSHAATPTTAYLDTLGRTFLTVADNGASGKFTTRIMLDIESNQREVIDRMNRIVMRYEYDMLGNRIHQSSMETGELWTLNDVTGKAIRTWDSRGFMRRMTYDELRRPTGLFVTENNNERLAERTLYGESEGDANNHKTRVFKIFDAAGVVTNESYDFKGNLLQSKRELLPDYQQDVDWNQNPTPNDGTFTSSSEYDALDRATSVTAPNGSVYRPTFNEANLLNKVDVKLPGATDATPFVSNIDYSAKGERTAIVYGNDAATTLEYDPLTSRLTKMKTVRQSVPNGLASQLFTDTTTIQDLHYTYDPVGNIIHIADDALAAIQFNNENVEGHADYIYDPVYRLISARGREHIGQTSFAFNPSDHNFRDFPFLGSAFSPNDLQAVRHYTETYQYDEAGNIQQVQHSAINGTWTRNYVYDEDSLLEGAARKSNRLTRTEIGNGNNFTETYSYLDSQGNDVHGCATAINSMELTWGFKDELKTVDLGGGGMVFHVYDARGQRVRKVVHGQSGAKHKEHIYLAGFEIYREFNGGLVDLERETLHIMDDKQRIALVEIKTIDTSVLPDTLPETLIRYQLGNHLGSASLELDDNAEIISYEEYYSYGSTSYQAARSQTEASKRYRYNAKERDEETGFYYYGARYYVSWLGRWINPDPAGLSDGLNTYSYVKNNPVVNKDASGLTTITTTDTMKYVRWGWKSVANVNLAARLVPAYQNIAPVILAESEKHGIPLHKALIMVAQATVEQSVTVHDPELFKKAGYRMFNMQVHDREKEAGGNFGLPGVKSNKLDSDESPTKKKKDIKTSPFFSFTSKEASVAHFLTRLSGKADHFLAKETTEIKALMAGYKNAYDSLKDASKGVNDYTTKLKKVGYAQAETYAEDVRSRYIEVLKDFIAMIEVTQKNNKDDYEKSVIERAGWQLQVDARKGTNLDAAREQVMVDFYTKKIEAYQNLEVMKKELQKALNDTRKATVATAKASS